MSTQCSILGLLNWCPTFKSSHRNSFGVRAPADFIYMCPISNFQMSCGDSITWQDTERTAPAMAAGRWDMWHWHPLHADVIKWKHFPRYWLSHTKASDAELWCFLWSAPEQTARQTLETPVIWDAIHHNALGLLSSVGPRLWWHFRVCGVTAMISSSISIPSIHFSKGLNKSLTVDWGVQYLTAAA